MVDTAKIKDEKKNIAIQSGHGIKMIVQMKLSEEETKKLWHITQAASQHLDKDYNVATLCLNIVRAYLDKYYIEVIVESKDKRQED